MWQIVITRVKGNAVRVDCRPAGVGWEPRRCRFHYSSSIDWILCCRLKILLATGNSYASPYLPGK